MSSVPKVLKRLRGKSSLHVNSGYHAILQVNARLDLQFEYMRKYIHGGKLVYDDSFVLPEDGVALDSGTGTGTSYIYVQDIPAH
jgi:hypothetical protein